MRSTHSLRAITKFLAPALCAGCLLTAPFAVSVLADSHSTSPATEAAGTSPAKSSTGQSSVSASAVPSPSATHRDIVKGAISSSPNPSSAEISDLMRHTAQDAFGNDRSTSSLTVVPGGISIQRFADGTVVYTEQYGAVAMNTQVFERWSAERAYSGFAERVGLPKSWSKNHGALYTQFEHQELFWDEQNQVPRWSHSLTEHDALVIGDSQVWDGSWIGQGIRAAGFTPAMYRCGGVGFVTARPGVCPSYYEGVVEGVWALPQGDPKVIYLDASGNDVPTHDIERVRAHQRQTIQKLQKLYPKSQIVLGGVVSNTHENHAARREYNESARAIAQETGVKFLDTTGWLSERLSPDDVQSDTVHIKKGSQHKLTPAFAEKLQKLLGDEK